MPLVASAGSVHATVTFRGRTAHSARPWEGDNAITRAAGFIAEVGAIEPEDCDIDGIVYRTVTTITSARYLKEMNPAVRIIGAQPSEGSRIPGIRKWPEAYLPKIYDPTHVDEIVQVSQVDAEEMARRLARDEGIFAGISAAGACWVALELARRVDNATIVFIVCDRGDRYLSTGVFPV